MNSPAPKEPAARVSRPRTRIGSDDALRWARNLPISNPFAKSILRAVANYMNEDGAAWPGISTIAADTDIAEDTIVARLRWCESIGAVALLKSWVDENGRRNHDGRGRVTSTEIRFLFDADLDEIAANAASATKPKALRGAALTAHEAKAVSPRPHGELTEEISPRHGRELDSDGSGLAPGLPPTPSPRIEELEEDSPPNPPPGGSQHDAVDQEGEAEQVWPHAESWARFEAAWREPILHQTICRQIWAAFTDDERDRAIEVAAGYVIWRSKQKRPPNVVNAQKILRERDAWAGFAAHAPAKPKVIEPPPKTWILADTAEYVAVALCCEIAGFELPKISGEPPGFEFVGKIPAGAAAMAAHARDGWIISRKDTPQFTAWCERIREWTGKWPQDKHFWLDEHDNIVPTAAEAYRRPPAYEGEPPNWIFPKSKDGLLVPPTPRLPSVVLLHP